MTTTSSNTSTVTRYFVQTDKSDSFWCSGETYDEAVSTFADSLERHRRMAESLRRRGVPESEVADLEADTPATIRRIIRRTEITTRETTEEQLPYPPEDQ